jgi:hypothetical protein
MHCLRAFTERVVELRTPMVCLRTGKVDRTTDVAVVVGGIEGSFRQPKTTFEIVGVKRLLGGARVVVGRAPGVASELEVFGKKRAVRFTPLFQPHSGEAMRRHTVCVCQHSVRGIANECVAERELGVADDPRVLVSDKELTLDEIREASIDIEIGRTGEKRVHRAAPEDSAKDARCAKEATRVLVQAFEALLDQGEDRLRNGPDRPARRATEELLEKKRISSRLEDETPNDSRVRILAEDVAREALRWSRREGS